MTKYAHDANNQLVQVQYPQGGLENYSYDAAGNRLGRSADGIQENYHYDNCNRLTQMTRMTTQQETVTYSYDRQGNMLSDGKNRYAYDAFGRLASTVTAEGDIQKNCYDAEGLRTEMEENGRLVQFLYNEDREVVAEKDYSGNIIRYIRGLGLISSDSENAKTYYHYVCDEQGSVSHIIRGEDKESGVSEQGREQDREQDRILNHYEYDAFGNTISCKEQVENRFRYQGEQYDPITLQYYLRARYYNPVIGRFIQEDTYYGDGLNLYEYCRNNTITYKDPTGHNICPTQRDLYHKYKEEGMSPQEAYQKMRKELGLDSKSGYKDSGVGNGKDPWRSYETSYGKSTLNSLKNTENFTDSAIEHIFEGQVNARGKAVGYHYEGIEGTSGNVIPGTESSVNNIGIYKAKVEVNGIPKTASGGFSSFYPKSMSPQEVIGSINEAYRNRVYIRGNTYSGLTSSGMEIEMFLDKNGKIISAYPVY